MLNLMFIKKLDKDDEKKTKLQKHTEKEFIYFCSMD